MCECVVAKSNIILFDRMCLDKCPGMVVDLSLYGCQFYGTFLQCLANFGVIHIDGV